MYSLCVCEAYIHAKYAHTGGSGACPQKILDPLEMESENVFNP